MGIHALSRVALWLDDDDADLQDDFESAQVDEEQRALVESFETAHQQVGNNAFVAAGHDAEAAMAKIITRAEAPATSGT